MLGGPGGYVSPLRSTRTKAKMASKATPSPLRSARQKVSNPRKNGGGNGDRSDASDREEILVLPVLNTGGSTSVSGNLRDAWVTPRKPGEGQAVAPNAALNASFDSWDEWKYLEMVSQDYLNTLSSPPGGGSDKNGSAGASQGPPHAFSMEKAIEVLETIVQENSGLSQDAKHKVDVLQAEAVQVHDSQRHAQAYMEQMYQTIQMLRGELEQALRSDSKDHQHDAKAALDELNALELQATEDHAESTVENSSDLSEQGTTSKKAHKSSKKRVDGSFLAQESSPTPKSLDLHARGAKLEHEYCASLGKNVELQLRNQKLARQMNQTNDEFMRTQEENQTIAQQLEYAKQQVAKDQKLIKFLQKESSFLKNELLTSKMQHVELYHQMANHQQSFAHANAQLQQQVDSLSQQNHFLTCEISETKCLMRFQSDKMEQLVQLAKQEKQKLVCCIAETRLKFKEWKENESSTLKAARDQAVHNLKTEYELKIARHHEEKQKLRDKVKDLEVSLRLLQRDRSLSPMELSQRKAAILSGNSSGTGVRNGPGGNNSNNFGSGQIKWQATSGTNPSNTLMATTSFSSASCNTSTSGASANSSTSAAATWNPNAFTTCEAELIAAQSKIKELEALLEHAKDYQRHQDHIIQVSEATISRLIQEREAAALESLSNSNMLSNVLSPASTQQMTCGVSNNSCYVSPSSANASSSSTSPSYGFANRASTPLEYLPSSSPRRGAHPSQSSSSTSSSSNRLLAPMASLPHLNVVKPRLMTNKGINNSAAASNSNGAGNNLPRLESLMEANKPRTPNTTSMSETNANGTTPDNNLATDPNDPGVPIELIKRRSIVSPQDSSLGNVDQTNAMLINQAIVSTAMANVAAGMDHSSSPSPSEIEAVLAAALASTSENPDGTVDPEKEILRRTSLALSVEVEKYRNLVVQSHREIQALKDTNRRRRSQIANVINASNDPKGNLVLKVHPQQLLAKEQQQIPLGGGGSMTSREKFLTEEVTRLSLELEKIRLTRTLMHHQPTAVEPRAATGTLAPSGPPEHCPATPPLREVEEEDNNELFFEKRDGDDDQAMVIQRRYRTHLAREEFKSKQQAADKIKARYRGYLVRQNTQIMEPKTRAILTITKGMQRKIESLPCHFHTTLTSYGKKFPAQIRVSRNPPLMLVQVEGNELEQQRRYMHLNEVLSVLPQRRHCNVDEYSPQEIAQAIAPMLRLVLIGQKVFRVVIRKSSEAHLNIHTDDPASSSAPATTTTKSSHSPTTTSSPSPPTIAAPGPHDPHGHSTSGGASPKKHPEHHTGNRTITRKLTGPIRINPASSTPARVPNALDHCAEGDEHGDDVVQEVEHVSDEQQLDFSSKIRPKPCAVPAQDSLDRESMNAADAKSPRKRRTKPTDEPSNACMNHAATMDHERVHSIPQTSPTLSSTASTPYPSLTKKVDVDANGSEPSGSHATKAPTSPAARSRPLRKSTLSKRSPSDLTHKGSQLSQSTRVFHAELLDHPANIKQLQLIKKKAHRMAKTGDYVLVSLFLLGPAAPAAPAAASAVPQVVATSGTTASTIQDVLRVHLLDSETMQEFACDFSAEQLGFLWSDDVNQRKRIVNHLEIERVSTSELRLTLVPHSIASSPAASSNCLTTRTDSSESFTTTIDQVKVTASRFVDKLFASILLKFKDKEHKADTRH